MAKEFHLRIVTPDRTVVDRKVLAVSFMGMDGSYGILANHAPMMTATQPGVVRITESDGSKEELVTTDGFAEVRDNVLTLVCEAGERAEEIDVERAREAERRARERIEQIKKGQPGDLPRAEAALRRALLRQLVGRRASTTEHVR